MRVYACVCVCMQVYTLTVFWLTVGNDHKRSKENLAPSEGIIIWVYWFSALLETVLLRNNVCEVIRRVQFPFFMSSSSYILRWVSIFMLISLIHMPMRQSKIFLNC